MYKDTISQKYLNVSLTRHGKKLLKQILDVKFDLIFSFLQFCFVIFSAITDYFAKLCMSNKSVN